MFGGFFGGNRFSYMDPPSSDSEDDGPDTILSKTAGDAEEGDENGAPSKLSSVLDSNEDDAQAVMGMDTAEDLEEEAKQALQGMCEECGDQPASLLCQQCDDSFCDVCYMAQHKRGKRAQHTTTKIDVPAHLKGLMRSQSLMDPTVVSDVEGKEGEGEGEEAAEKKQRTEMTAEQKEAARREAEEDLQRFSALSSSSSASSSSSSAATPAVQDLSCLSPNTANGIVFPPSWFVERAKFIPLRLTMKERKCLRLVEAAMNVSEYTDKIDIISYKDKAKRIMAQLKDVCAILSGLVVATDYKTGQSLIVDREFKDNETFFQDMFELARRHKIRNPEKMRDAYGKLVYLLQDSQIPEIQELLEFSLVRPIRTVHSLLEEKGQLAMLSDPVMTTATGEIMHAGLPRPQIDRLIKTKERAIEYLARKYSTSDKNGLSYDDARNCILSVGDNHSYLRSNRDPCDRMLRYLTTLFKPDTYTAPWSLAIVGGRGGARLTHSHSMQYHYVAQSLTLWREIAHDMFRLWSLSEQDLLDGSNQYRLRNTGQGLNRVQSCPRIGRAMHSLLSSCQRKTGGWVGSSVVHLGDSNVPNALMFIDKYNQVSRILNPIVLAVEQIEKLYESKPDVKLYVDKTFGGLSQCRMTILTDFFRHAFDGSGADNFFDAGSCIDGRLTSAWNWCNSIDKKPFYNVFLLTGFVGFDGEFR